MRGLYLQVLHEGAQIFDQDVLRVHLWIARNVRRRKAALTVRDAAVQSVECADLRFPRPVIAGELVAEDDRHATAGVLVIELDTVDFCARHAQWRWRSQSRGTRPFGPGTGWLSGWCSGGSSSGPSKAASLS